MAMLIVPEALAEELSENGDEYLRNWARGKGETATNGGFITVDEKDDNDKPYQIYVAQHQSEVTRSWSNDYYRWCYNSQWDDMSGDLTVPDDWYVVRFFFVAVDTCSSSISVGNIVDAVSFSQDVPSFEGYGAANVTVTKKVYGLDDLTETKAKELLNSKRFIDGVVLENWTKDTDSEGKVYYEASGTVTERMFSDKDVTYKEEFANAQLDGYKLTSAKAEYGSTTDEVNLPSEKKELEVNVTLQKGQDKTIVFTNTYTPATTSLTVTKHVAEGNATAPAGATFKFKLTVGNAEQYYSGVTFEPGTNVNTTAKPNEWTFTLQAGHSATISGIRLNDTNVKVEEVEVDSKHYSTKYSVNDGTETAGTEAELGTLQQTSNTVDFTNTYNIPNLKSMTIKKVVTGAFGERTKDFTFKVELTKDGAKVIGVNHTNQNGANVTDLSNFTLKHGQQVTLEEIPIGTTITITESNANDYKTKATNYEVNSDKEFIYVVVADENGNAVLKSKDNNQLVANSAITVTNDFDGTPDTGVLLDTLPYLILLAVAVAGGVLVVVRKRKHRDE